MRLFSTKILSLNLKDRLIQQGFSIVEYPFIKINPIAHIFTKIQKNIIVTSQNAVRIALNNTTLKSKLGGENYFCVGEKTKTLLEEKGQNVVKMCQNAALLANFITENHKNDSFSFFCGKQRRPEIEKELTRNNITITTHEIYETLFTPKAIETAFDGVLFFSPSAVVSYFKKNTWNSETKGFCIGSTTAESLSKFTKNYSVAKTPNENQLLLSIHNYYTNDYAQK